MTEEISYPVINKEICKGCMRCIVGCPQNAILLSEEMNNAGYQFAYYSGSGCTGCKDCIGSAGCLSGGQLITKYGLMDWRQEK